MKAFVVEELSVGALRALNYSPAVERIRLAGSSSARPLSKIVKHFGPAYGTVFTRLDCTAEHGVELITQGDMFAAEPSGRMIRLDSMRQPDQHLVTEGQVLIAGAGTLGQNELYGRSILADDRLVGKYVGPHSMSLHFEEPDSDDALFAYAWLASPTGIQALRSTSYGTKILGIRKDLLRTLPVPVADAATVRRVAGLVRRCTSGRNRFLRNMQRARSEVLSSFPELQDAAAMLGQQQLQYVLHEGPFSSIRAWNYAAGRGAVAHLRSRWDGTLREALAPSGAFNGPRFVRSDCDPQFGVEFLSQRDVFMIRPVGRRIRRPDIPDRLLFVPREALLVGSTGQVTPGSLFGQVELASFAGWKCGVTQHILRLLPMAGARELIFAILGTSVGQAMLRSTAYGTSIPSVRIDLLLGLPFPAFERAVAARVKSAICAAEAARIDADEAEAEAIRIIEEEVLPQWLA